MIRRIAGIERDSIVIEIRQRRLRIKSVVHFPFHILRAYSAKDVGDSGHSGTSFGTSDLFKWIGLRLGSVLLL